MSTILKGRPVRRGARSMRAAVLVLGLAGSAVVMASPAQAKTYTADACSGASNTQCMFSGTSGNGAQAQDKYALNNNTLDQWKFHGSSTFIATHLGSAIIWQNSKIAFCTGYSGTGTCAHVAAHGSDPFARFQNPSYNRLLSFAWNK